MKVVEFLDERAVVAVLGATHKAGVIRELSQVVAQSGGVDAQTVEDVLLARERLGSTGIGDGVAIPHGTLPGLKRLTAAFGRSPTGVDFDSSDGQPAHLFFVLLTPDSAVGLQALARVSRLMRRSSFKDRLMEAPDARAIHRILSERDD